MTITVTEKEHWKARIGRKVEQAIETLLSREDPAYLERIETQARKQAYESLGLAEFKARLDEIDNQEALAKEERKGIWRQMVARVTGSSETQQSYWRSMPHEVRQALAVREKTAKQELMAQDELGRKLLALQREQEELLDAVWLATSSKQIKELWQRTSDMLEQDQTPLQASALEIEPSDTAH